MTDTIPTVTRVALYGPNGMGRWSRHHDFVAHAAGCADCARLDRDPMVDDATIVDVATRHALGDWLYADHIDEGSMTPGEGESTIDFKPCLKALALGDPIVDVAGSGVELA